MNSKHVNRLPLSLISIAVVTLLSACGGGGGSASPGDTQQPVPTATPTPSSAAPTNAAQTLNPSDPSNAAAAHARGVTGAGVTVAVVDIDFNVADPEFAGRLSKTVYASGGAGNPHGSEVAEALGGTRSGVAPAVSMLGAAVGTGGDNVSFSNPVYQDLYNKGARIFNQSNAFGTIAAPAGNGPTFYNIYQPFVAQGSLFIWAAGNDGSAHPSLTAGLPALYPDLQKGWLAVVAVNAAGGAQGYSSSDTTPGVISSYSNRCGEAANWCLAAPGDFVSATANGRVYGTSFAAPAVSGAAALVQQVFPWMSADQIRQTILSTATSIGDTATYGWGLLNASKAANGPALFDTRLTLGGNFVAKFDAASAAFGNDIGGNAGLLKDGSGTLTLAGNNTYSGANEVLKGTLNVTGSLASAVTIDSAGILSGDGGRVGGSVFNYGRLSNTGNGMTIGGNYTASAGAVLANQFNSTLTVGGSATLGNSHLVATTPAGSSDPSGYVAQQIGVKGKVLTAANGVSGQFQDVSFEHDGITFNPGTFLSATLAYTANEVDLTVARNNVQVVAAQAFAADPTRRNSAANVEQGLKAADALVASGNTGGNNSAFLSSAAALQRTPDLAAAAQVLDSLSGQIYASSQALTFQQSQAINRDLSNRLSLLANPVSGSVKAGLWASVIGATGKLSESGYASADTSTWGGQFGFDTHLNDKAIVGAALSYSESKASFDRFGGASNSQNTGLSLYGRYALSKDGIYVSGRAGIARVSSKINRSVILGSEVDSLSSSHTDSVMSTYAETGYVRQLSPTSTLTPFAGISYDRLKRGAFTEAGSAFGLTAGSKAYQQTASVLGLRGDARFDWLGGTSNLQAYAAWQHGFNDGRLDFNAAFVAAPTAGFTVQGIGLPRNGGWAGVGISSALAGNWSWYGNYDAQFGKGGLANSVFSAGVRKSF
ncbi:autotransporter serine protease [Collimonas silvisoli]|uniref:autotransporter serine protease n=1 Tax=Collimonas silvisoli TaxID=2825884 RepID=UPI001B8CD918|nr:autotransporter serine protease [Collimonas silvisoli]